MKRSVIILFILILGPHPAQAVDKTGEIYDAIKSENVEKVKINLAADTNAVNSVVEKRFTLLHFAAEHRSSNGTQILKLLLDKGAKVEARNHIGQTPLFCAAIYDNPEGTRILIAEGAKVNARSSDGRTPLDWAAVNGYCDVAKVLIANQADKKTRDSYGNTPLDFALQGRSDAKGDAALTRQYNDMITLLQEKVDTR